MNEKSSLSSERELDFFVRVRSSDRGGFGIVRNFDLGNVGSDASELGNDVLIAAFNVADIVDLGSAPGAESCDYHCNTCAEVTSGDLGAGELGNAFDNGGLALHVDVGAHAAKLVHVAEAVFVDLVGEEAGALCETETACDLGLHVGGVAGVGESGNVGGAEALFGGTGNADIFVAFGNFNADLGKLRGYAFKVLGNYVVDNNISAGGGN